MTREEAWNRIDVIIEKHEVDDMYVTIINVSDYDALRYARKVLKQDSKTDIFNKIKTEIEQAKVMMNEEIVNHDRKDLINFINGINQCLMIIDKYRQEG